MLREIKVTEHIYSDADLVTDLCHDAGPQDTIELCPTKAKQRVCRLLFLAMVVERLSKGDKIKVTGDNVQIGTRIFHIGPEDIRYKDPSSGISTTLDNEFGTPWFFSGWSETTAYEAQGLLALLKKLE